MRFDNIQQEVSITAQRIFERKNQIPLRVLFLWYRTFPSDIQFDRLAAYAAHLIEENIPQDVFGATAISMEVLSTTPLREFVGSISITRLSQAPSIWAAGVLLPSVDFPPPSSVPQEPPVFLNPQVAEISQPSDEDYKRMLLMRHIMNMVPQERQLEMLRLIQEMKQDMEQLSLKDFTAKWELQDDEF